MSLEQLLNLPLASEFLVVIISTLPISELRGAIPVGIINLGLPWYTVLPLAIVGNIIPVPIILIFINRILHLLSKVTALKGITQWIYRHAEQRSEIIERYERLGLLMLVSIPLPFTGAWTGSLVAAILNQSFWPSFLTIAGGVVIAGIIVVCLTMLGWLGAVIAGVALSAIIALSVSRRLRHN